MSVVDRLVELLGPEQVATAERALAEYDDPYSFTDDAMPPLAVCYPTSVDEVRSVVRLANELRAPLWTVSRGRNFAYGGARARVPDSIVVDLQRMNRVLEVNEELGYAVVEPGVSFSDLHADLRDNGHALWVDVPDLSWGSIIGNTLERGFGYTSYGDHASHVCGMEVVLADGDVMRTGMGAMDSNQAWALYRGGYGPGHDSLFMQSNFGVVTKLGVWLMPRPESSAVCMASVSDRDSLGPLVDAMRPLMLDGTIQSNSMIGNVLAIASMVASRATWYDGPGLIPDEAVRAICEKLGIGWWNARFAMYGDRRVVGARVARAREALSVVPGLELSVTDYPGDVIPETVPPPDRAQLGVPSTDLIRMAGWRGGRPSHIDFSLVCPPTGRHAATQMSLIRRRIESHGLDYAGGFTLNPRHAIALALISFDGDNPADRTTVRQLFPQLIADAAAAGYAPYRAHVEFMDSIADVYDFNDHALRRFNQRLKDALDPNGVLSPGKQGIWPSAK